jgi:hypothetical protein
MDLGICDDFVTRGDVSRYVPQHIQRGPVDLFVSFDFEQPRTQTAVDAMIVRASRPTVQNGVTLLGVVCEAEDGFSNSEGIDWCRCGVGEYGRM